MDPTRASTDDLVIGSSRCAIRLYLPIFIYFELLAQRLASLVYVYHQTNFLTQKLIAEIRPHDTSFSKSSQLLIEWIAQFQLTRLEWEEWDDVIKVELAQ